ncbi:MAG: energy-coupling factor transporter ATPase [Anaerolineaceae bacterium]|nr:energy-coupling factor transporter ATPase [Anaerolineaceae bacterium]
MQPLIIVDRLNFDHVSPNGSRVAALRGVSLEIHKGELVSLIGANGSGKSTLARHFNALHIPTSGKVWVNGLDTSLPGNHAQIRSHVGMVFQNPEDQMIASIVEEEVAFGLENMGVSRPEMIKRIRAVLKEYDLWEERSRPPHLLSSGQIQRLALAGVLAMQPECIIFDETTAMLDPVGRQTVMQSIREMHRQGMTILYITHAMEEAAQADRMIVLDKGRVAMDDTPASVFSKPKILDSLGLELPEANHLARQLARLLPSIPSSVLSRELLLSNLPAYDHAKYKPDNQPPGKGNPNGHSLIEVRKLEHVYLAGTPLEHRSLKGVDLSVNEQDVHALLGPTGSGKSTLLQHINGLFRPQSGSVRVDRYNLSDPAIDMQSLRSMVGLVFQNPDMQLFEQFVGDEIAFGPRLAGLTGAQLRKRVRQAMELVGLGFSAYKDRFTIGLSGGERKNVTLASALALNPHILLLDEPLAGLDPHSRKGLLDALKRMVKSGLTLILSSHNITEITQIASHVSLVQDGRIAAAGSSASIFSYRQVMERAGLIAPLVPTIADELRARGWPLPPDIYQEKQLLSAIKTLQEAGT